MRTLRGQLALSIVKARSALERADYAAAEQALGDAERLDAQAAPVTELRRNLQAAQRRDTRKTDRLTSLLTAMRTALA